MTGRCPTHGDQLHRESSSSPLPIYTCPTCEGLQPSVEARLARAEQTIDLLLRIIHAHAEQGEGRLDSEPSFNGFELLMEWNAVMGERFGHLPEFKPLDVP